MISAPQFKPQPWTISPAYIDPKFRWMYDNRAVMLLPMMGQEVDKYRSVNGLDINITNSGNRLRYTSDHFGNHAAQRRNFNAAAYASRTNIDNYGSEFTVMMMFRKRYTYTDDAIRGTMMRHSTTSNDGWLIEQTLGRLSSYQDQIALTFGGVAEYKTDIPTADWVKDDFYLMFVVCSGDNGTAKVCLKNLSDRGSSWEHETLSPGVMGGTPDQITLGVNQSLVSPTYDEWSYVGWWPYVVPGFTLEDKVDLPMEQVAADPFGWMRMDLGAVGSAPAASGNLPLLQAIGEA